MPITDQTFDGLAFPVAKVRYTGSGYAATIYRDRDMIYRVRASYNAAIGGGARGALPIARQVFAKCLQDQTNGLAREGEFVAIPGDYDQDHYTFTFVPVEILTRNAGGLQLSQDARTFVGLLAHADVDTNEVYAASEVWQETRETFPVIPDEHTDPFAAVYLVR